MEFVYYDFVATLILDKSMLLDRKTGNTCVLATILIIIKLFIYLINYNNHLRST